jgi:Tfp pilus assembly protein PilW
MEKTVFQTFSTRRTDRRSQRAFTLVELLVGTTLSGFLLTGVLSTFLMMGRTGANIRNYTEIEAKARRSLEDFSREARLAYSVASTYSGTSVTLSIPDTTSDPKGTGTGAYTVTYTFDSSSKQLTRTGPPIDNPTGTVATTTLIDGVQLIPGTTTYLNYYRYYTDGSTDNNVLNTREIKQIEVSFQLQRQDTTVTAATNKVLSARFILRNK